MPPADVAVSLLLGALTALSRVPFRAHLLPTWDAVQFALALDRYDIVAHRPHPPGYILYVAAARAVEALGLDATQSFVWLSVLASGATIALSYRLGWMLYGRLAAAVAAVGLAASPLFWIYGELGLPYAVEAALAAAVAVLTWPARCGQRRFVLWSALALGVAGGVRQSLLLVLLPFWVAMVWAGMRRAGPLLAGAVAMAATAALWLVPMVWLTGGPAAYLRASRELFQSTVEPGTALGAAGAWLGNVRGGIEALALGMGLLTPALVCDLSRRLRRPPDSRDWFLAAWILPPLGVYVGVHFGQYGYLLTVLPALYILIAPGLAAVLATPTGALRPTGAAALAGALVVHVLFVLGAPPIPVPEAGEHASGAARALASATALYRYRIWSHTVPGLREQEAVIAAYTAAIRRDFDPANSAIVVELGNRRSYPWFRHVTYYLPEFRTYHLRLPPWSRGYLDSARLASMAARDDDRIALPPGVRRLVWMVDHWNPAMPRPPGLRELALPYGRRLYVLDLDGRVVEHGGYQFEPASAPAPAASRPGGG